MIETRFKKTEIGEIPVDWEVYNLGDYVDEIAEGPFGSKLKREHYTSEKEARIIQLGNIGENGWNDENVKYTTFDHAKEISKCIVRPNEIVIAKMMPAGRAIICPRNEKMYILSSDAVRLKPKENIDTNYLFRAINSIYYRRQIQDKTQGSTRVRTNIAKLIESLIILPESLPEQQQIATALSDIDTLLSALNKKIEKKKLIKQGVMRQLLTGEKRLTGFTGPWVKKNISETCTIKARIGWQGLKTNEYLDYGNYVLITGTDFDNGFINWTKCSYVSKDRFEQDENIKIKQGDVLITKDGSIGKVAYLDFIPMEGTLNSGVFVVRPKNSYELNNYYLALIFKSKFFEDFIAQLKAGSTIVHLYQKDFVKFQLYYPTDLSEQTAIATILSDMDKEIEELEAKRAKYKQVKRGMMQQLLTGKIRLVSEV